MVTNFLNQKRNRFICFTFYVFLLLAICFFCTGSTSLAVIINEIDADMAGPDTEEFVELYDGGLGNTSLSGLVVVLYNGTNDTSYAAYDLDSYSTDVDGYFVLGNAAVPGVDLTFSDSTLQNGADAVALYQDDASNFPNGTVVSTTNLIDAIVYDIDNPDDLGLLVLLNGGEPQVNENGKGNKDGHSLQRIPNGSGGERNTSSYDQCPPTPDAFNQCGAAAIPTLSEWGIIIFMTVMLGIGVLMIARKRRIA